MRWKLVFALKQILFQVAVFNQGFFVGLTPLSTQLLTLRVHFGCNLDIFLFRTIGVLLTFYWQTPGLILTWFLFFLIFNLIRSLETITSIRLARINIKSYSHHILDVAQTSVLFFGSFKNFLIFPFSIVRKPTLNLFNRQSCLFLELFFVLWC